MLRTFFSLLAEGAKTTDCKKRGRFSQQSGLIYDVTLKQKQCRKSQQYQERWWQPISENALSKQSYSTEVHPRTENLKQMNTEN